MSVVVEAARDGYVVSSDPTRLDTAAIHAFLTRSYWSPGIPIETVRRAIEGSLAVGLYQGAAQVGFARAVTDRATFAYLADVYVLEEHRGRGLGEWMVGTLLAHPELQGLRRVLLVTRDAHALYRRLGFAEPANPRGFMEVVRRNLYSESS